MGPLHSTQYACEAEKSVNTTLAKAVSHIEKGIRGRGMVLVIFSDVDGAFNRTTREAILIGIREHMTRDL